MAKLLEGKILAQKLKQDLSKEIAGLQAKLARPLALESIVVGDHASSSLYCNAQKKTAESLNIEYRLHTLGAAVPEQELIGLIERLNRDETSDGILVQMPLPGHIDYKRVSRFIAPQKDVEGMHPANIGKLLFGKAKIVPCTAAAVMALLKETAINLRGKSCVIVGHSEIVGKPLSLLLLDEFATVSVCHIATSEAGRLKDYVQQAEVLAVAVGKAGIVKGEWIKKDAVVIDVGINRVADKTVGDVEFDEAAKRASWITPVPGGVGPLTVVMLMKNLVEAVKQKI